MPARERRKLEDAFYTYEEEPGAGVVDVDNLWLLLQRLGISGRSAQEEQDVERVIEQVNVVDYMDFYFFALLVAPWVRDVLTGVLGLGLRQRWAEAAARFGGGPQAGEGD